MFDTFLNPGREDFTHIQEPMQIPRVYNEHFLITNLPANHRKHISHSAFLLLHP
ncbi:hypothetical protein Acaty_c1821 [Acidithiobacillus caldus ATCC 51756]|uniref:Uncharacterized protein n=1 Tax=Acidithiobacillus caldus (strain ATCC 51756 / DSM 8584 / KU) TaxID=637389 RepID=A0A059ZVQ7_ACICK|nr:hypothetical protein Acaty_c1821 [Acidithiobacillus caldus ATCC 51756]